MIRTEVPHFRIISEELWAKVQDRYAENTLSPRGPSPRIAVRPRYLLSGKLTCGVSGGPMIRSGADQRFMCSWRRERGKSACTNGRGIKSGEIEARVLAAIKNRLLAPGRVALAVEEARLAAENEARTISQARSKLESELAEVKRRAERLVDQIADGPLTGATVKDRLDALEARRAQIEGELTQAPVAPVVALHPRVAEHYRPVVGSLERASARSDSEATTKARDLVRKLIETVVVTRLEKRGKFALTIQGRIAALVNQDGENTTVLGAGVGFEPTTFRL
ncbi:zinc ribbon domain-containing protein [Brevundimonas sp. Leaf168]|uniref:zinc ribbon domain-containing protein n=1 Tax=Brevundimonas sp. Leaf168 TaxID=1736283 RepID=UPI003518D18E